MIDYFLFTFEMVVDKLFFLFQMDSCNVDRNVLSLAVCQAFTKDGMSSVVDVLVDVMERLMPVYHLFTELTKSPDSSITPHLHRENMDTSIPSSPEAPDAASLAEPAAASTPARTAAVPAPVPASEATPVAAPWTPAPTRRSAWLVSTTFIADTKPPRLTR